MAKINLKKISEEQLERERNPNYKYFDVPELRYKDGRPMRKYNSPKLQAIEMENKQTAVEWLVEELNIWQTIADEDTNATLDTVRKLLEQAKQMEKEQKEISDEEITKQGFLHSYLNELPDENAISFIQGAKWVAEYIKKQK